MIMLFRPLCEANAMLVQCEPNLRLPDAFLNKPQVLS
jgi:hypothetical protein